MECPKNAGSAFFNYKNFHSIVLLAVCDANYCFTLVDVGAFGRSNDSGVLADSPISKAFENAEIKLPGAKEIHGKSFPYVLVGDTIFPLKTWLMVPYPGKYLKEEERIYNYRLSRAQRTIENTFGILAAKWRVFRRPIRGNVDLVQSITMATICLHNYLQLTENAMYIPTGFVDSEDSSGNVVTGDWRELVNGEDSGMTNLQMTGGNRYKFSAGNIRKDFNDYFNSVNGQVPWQIQHVRDCGKINSLTQ